MKRTRIVATIGPACSSITTISKLIAAGLNVTRLNFSHGVYEEHARYISMIRTAAKRAHRTITILQDLSGPKIRAGELPPQGLTLEEGKTILFSNNPRAKNAITFQYLGLPRDMHTGDHILLDDGLMEVEVLSTTTSEIAARVVVGGILLSHKGINVPSTSLRIPSITDKDKKDLKFGVAHRVDWVALSFVRDPRDIEQLRALIAKEPGKHKPKIIAKIEKFEAVQHLEEIIRAADGIMVARGDLGIEIPAEQVPLVQKRIIRLCRQYEKPVIVATQMLDSMIRNPRPTRAEVSDVANAVLDQTDGVMLSGETASGKYPVEAVTIMGKILTEVENDPEQLANLACIHSSMSVDFESQIIGEISLAAQQLHQAAAVIVPHHCIHLASILARFRPACMIIPQVTSDVEAGQVNVLFGMYPLHMRTLFKAAKPEALVREARSQKIIKAGDRVVVISETKDKERLLLVQEFTA